MRMRAEFRDEILLGEGGGGGGGGVISTQKVLF